MKLISVLIFAISVSSCVYIPKKVTVYDKKCAITVKEMQLETKQIELLSTCRNEQCYANILGAGVLSAGSAIISGSIVITANIAYWFEKQSQCNEPT